MIKNYVITAFRNLWRNKIFSSINVLGLALGMACSFLILLWVNDERSVDKFNAHTDQLYSVYERRYYDNTIEAFHSGAGLLAEEMKRVFPEVKYASGFAIRNPSTFQVADKIIKENGNCADKDFFKMFSYKLVAGDADNALNSPVSIALSRKMASDFFGDSQAALGKTIRYANKKDLTVTAVFENLPSNSSEKFDCLINWYTYFEERPWFKEWGNNGPSTYIMVQAGTDPNVLEKKLVHFLDKYITEKEPGVRIELGLQRFDDMYLHSRFSATGFPGGGRIEYVYLFSVVAIFILLIACINFMNLTTAGSVRRAKEISVRKVIGAFRSTLITQFIGEAIILSFIAMVIALALVILLLPAFNDLTQKQITLPAFNITFLLYIAGLVLVTGFISGIYPAFFLSSFNPISVLKRSLKLSTASVWFRKSLVVFQFVLCIVLLVGTLVVSKQINFIQTKNLGYDRENLIYIPVEGDLGKQYAAFKQQALNTPGIRFVSRISQSPTLLDNTSNGVKWEGKDPNVEPEFTQAAVGYDFVKTMNLHVLQGRDFSKEFPTDSSAYIINEEALKKIGYKDPIGKSLTFWTKKGAIIGLIKDFHFNSLHVAVDPLIIRLDENDNEGSILVKAAAGKTKQVLAVLGNLCKQLNPKFPFTYQFSDEQYAKLYNSEQVTGKLANSFSILAIFISCLGLLGLAIFTAEQRTKEIGVRKVLGASVSSLFVLLSREFLLFVVIALLIATPLAWFAMNKWLSDYAYRIEISWWMFLFAGGLAILIALFTVSFQAVKAAIANPVKSLRTE